jgi:hypothetical protein
MSKLPKAHTNYAYQLNQSVTSTYDDANRLIIVGAQAYTFDSANRLTSVSAGGVALNKDVIDVQEKFMS